MQNQAQRLFNGEKHSDRLSPAYQPEGKPIKPSDLDEVGKRVWKQQIEPLIEQGIATSVDQQSLEGLCHWASLYHRIRKQAMTLDDFTQTTSQRCLNNLKNAQANYNILAKHFGLTPLSRNAVAAGPQSDELTEEFGL